MPSPTHHGRWCAPSHHSPSCTPASPSHLTPQSLLLAPNCPCPPSPHPPPCSCVSSRQPAFVAPIDCRPGSSSLQRTVAREMWAVVQQQQQQQQQQHQHQHQQQQQQPVDLWSRAAAQASQWSTSAPHTHSLVPAFSCVTCDARPHAFNLRSKPCCPLTPTCTAQPLEAP